MLDIILVQLTTFGGPVLVALALVSIIALSVTIYKSAQFARLGVGRHKVARRAMAAWQAGDRLSALQLVLGDRSALSSVVASAMATLADNPGDNGLARQAATQTALAALGDLARHLRIIETVVQASPMLGLLGTVIGMIEAFGKVSEGGGAADPSALAGGIWIALTTTALGLTIAIPFYFVSSWLEGRVEGERAAMDAAIANVTFGK